MYSEKEPSVGSVSNSLTYKKFMHVPREKSSSKILFYKNESSWAVLMPQLHCQIGDSDHRRHHCQHPFYTDLKNNTAFTQLTMWTRRNRSINQHHKQTDRKMIATDEGISSKSQFPYHCYYMIPHFWWDQVTCHDICACGLLDHKWQNCSQVELGARKVSHSKPECEELHVL